MEFQLTDRYTFDKGSDLKPTRDGYLAATPRVARTGIQLYRGSEVGRPDMPVVRVYRPEDAVFSKKSLATMAHKPVTDDHPPVQVTADNWKKYAAGQTGAEVARDGQFIRVPMALMDGALIKKVKDGKAELSVGYSCEIIWGDGKTVDGQEYDAKQGDITVNHVAVVDAARGGDKLRIGDGVAINIDTAVLVSAVAAILKGDVNKTDVLTDGLSLVKPEDGSKGSPFFKDGTVYVSSLRAAQTDALTTGDEDTASALLTLLGLLDTTQPEHKAPKQEKTMNDKVTKSIMIDGITVETTDVGAQIIERHTKSLTDSVASLTKQLADANTANATKVADLEKQVATLTTDKATTEAKVVTLESQIKDAAMTPAKLDAMVLERKGVADKAVAILGDKAVIKDKTNTEIMKQVVDAKLGDKAKDWNESQIAASFEALTADVKTSGVQDTARAFSQAPSHDAATQSEARYAARDKRLTDAWKDPAPTAVKQ